MNRTDRLFRFRDGLGATESPRAGLYVLSAYLATIGHCFEVLNDGCVHLSEFAQ